MAVGLSLSTAACNGNVVVDSGTGVGTITGTGSSSGSSSNTFSCDFTVAEVHECSQYPDLPAAEVSAAQSECTAENGTSGSGCTTTGAFGSCALSSGGITYEEFSYEVPGETPDDAATACTDAGGTWTALM